MAGISKNGTTTRRIWQWLGIIFGFLLFLYLIRSILLPFVVGILTAYFLDPAADKLEKWGCSRAVATTLITVGFFTAIIIAVAALLPTLAQQIGDLVREFPVYYQQVRELVQLQLARLPVDMQWQAADGLGQFGDKILAVSQKFVLQLLQSGMVVVNLLSLAVITPVVAFYLLRDWDRIVERMERLLPRKHAPVIKEQWQKIDETLAGFIRGQLNVMLVLGAFYAIGLSLIGLKFAVLVGVLAGLLIIIPYLGTFISGALSVSIAYVQFGEQWWKVALVAGYFVIGQMLEGYFLTPKLVGERVGLHPVWVIFGMLAGGALFGFVGILLALPVTAIIGVLARFAVERYLESDLYQEPVKTKR